MYNLPSVCLTLVLEIRARPEILRVFRYIHELTCVIYNCIQYTSKTTGARIRVCPVVAVLAYIAVKPQVPGLLFMHRNECPLYGLTFPNISLWQWLNLACFTGHNFQIGAALSAAQAGLSESLIQTLDWWRSFAFQQYIQTPTATLLAASQVLVQAHTSPRNQT